MMQLNKEGTINDLVNYRFTRSNEDLETAKLLFNIASKSITADLISTADELTALIKDYCNSKITNATLN